MRRKTPTFPLPFATKPAPANNLGDCRRADMERPVLIATGGAVIELLRYRIRDTKRPLGVVPSGADLN